MEQGDRVTPNPEMAPQMAFSDLSPEETEKWAKESSHTSMALFVGKAEYEPWADGVPCAYILTKQDGAIPYALQQKMAEQLGQDALTVELDANHNPHLSVPEQVAAAVDKFVAA